MNPSGINSKAVTGGSFAALAKKYPQAVKDAAFGAENNPSVLEPEQKYEDAAETMGWDIKTFQTVPLTVTDGLPTSSRSPRAVTRQCGRRTNGSAGPHFQAMSTDSFNPAFVILGVQFYEESTIQGWPGCTCHRSTSRRRGGRSRSPRKTPPPSSCSR